MRFSSDCRSSFGAGAGFGGSCVCRRRARASTVEVIVGSTRRRVAPVSRFETVQGAVEAAMTQDTGGVGAQIRQFGQDRYLGEQFQRGGIEPLGQALFSGLGGI